MIERTQDYRRVKRLTLANPMGPGHVWDLIISAKVFYLIEIKDGQDLGVWCFEPRNGVYLMHTAMTPDCRGRDAVQSGLAAIRWLYENTPADAIVAPVPADLKHAQRIPRAAGLKYEGNFDGVKKYKMTRQLFNELKKAA